MGLTDDLAAREHFLNAKRSSLEERVAEDVIRGPFSRDLNRLQDLIKVQKAPGGAQGVRSVGVDRLKLITLLRSHRTADRFEAFVEAAFKARVLMNIGGRTRLMSEGDREDRASADVTDILRDVARELMGEEAAEVFGGGGSMTGEILWARIQDRQDAAALLLKVEIGGPARSLVERARAALGLVPRIPGTAILGPTSAFVAVGDPIRVLGSPHRYLLPLDGPTRERLDAAPGVQGGSRALLLVPEALLSWQRSGGGDGIVPGMEAVEVAWRLMKGLPLDRAGDRRVFTGDVPEAPPPSGVVGKVGRVARDRLPSSQKMEAALGTVAAAEVRRARQQGRRGRKAHTAIQQGRRPKAGARPGTPGPSPQAPTAVAPLKRGTVRRSAKGGPLEVSELMSEPLIEALERRLGEDARNAEEAQRDRVF